MLLFSKHQSPHMIETLKALIRTQILYTNEGTAIINAATNEKVWYSIQHLSLVTWLDKPILLESCLSPKSQQNLITSKCQCWYEYNPLPYESTNQQHNHSFLRQWCPEFPASHYFHNTSSFKPLFMNIQHTYHTKLYHW